MTGPATTMLVHPTHDRRGPARPAPRLGQRLGLGLGLGLVVAGCSLPGAGGGSPEEARGAATVVEVVDGDTVVVDIGGTEERVRLVGIDTPESVHPERPVECFGREASQRLAELLPAGTPVRLERDVEPRDVYGRLLAYVYRVADGLQVNLDQVAQGYAGASPYPPNTVFRADYAAAEHEARSRGTGMWSTCPN